MATSRQQSAAPNDANPHRPGPGGPGSRSTSNDSMVAFGYLFDDPSPGGAGLSGQPPERPDKSSSDPSRQPAVNMVGLPTPQPKRFDSGSTATPVINQWLNSSIPTHPPAHQQQRNTGPQVPTSKNSLHSTGAPRLPNTTEDTNPAGFTSLAKQDHISTPAGNKERTDVRGGRVSWKGGQILGSLHRLLSRSAPVHPSAGRGAPTSAQSPHQAHSQTGPHAKGSPPQPAQAPTPKPDSPAARKPSDQAIAGPKVSEPGSDTGAKVCPPGNDTAIVLGHGQSDSKEGAPSAKIPDNFADDGGSEGGGGRIAQVSKELVIKHDRRTPRDPRPDTTPSGASESFRRAANMVMRGLSAPRGSGDGNRNNPSTINDVESLKKGEIKTSKNKTNTPYTILLVGEIGVGKSSVLELIENVLAGKAIDQYNFKNHTNQDRGSTNQSRTDQAHLYQYTSTNGMTIRILDTPGLADIRGIQQDKLHMNNIASYMKENIDSVTAVLVVADGSAPGITVGTDYAFSTLSTIFPKSLANNIAFMFTNVPSPSLPNFSGGSIPDVLRGARQFHFDNPIAQLKNGSRRVDLKACEQNTLEMLMNLFDWLDSLEPQPMEESVSLYEKSRSIDAKVVDILAKKDEAAKMHTVVNDQTMELQIPPPNEGASSNTKGTINTLVWKKGLAPKRKYCCDTCHSICGGAGWFRRVFRMECQICKHPHAHHTHTPYVWVQEYDVWRKVPAPKRQYCCDECHLICRKAGRLRRIFRMQCDKCKHPHAHHSHTPYIWIQKKPTQTSVDEGVNQDEKDERKDAKKNEKKNEKITIESLVTALKQELAHLKKVYKISYGRSSTANGTICSPFTVRAFLGPHGESSPASGTEVHGRGE